MSDHDDASEAASRVRLSLLWAIYLGAFGCIFPYLVLHLETVVGLSKGRIGTVMAVIPLAGIIAQPLWGAASDQSGRRREIMVLLSLGGAVCLVILGRAESFGTVLAVALFMSIFVTALVPLLTASTFAAMGTRSRAAFGSVRLWGTLGFLLGMESVGRIARLDPEAGLLWFGSARFLVIAAALILAGGLMMRSMPPVADLSLRSPRGAARRLLSDPGVRRILL
ncbi:MAG: MFS transporter, partial [Salinibacterium sp.]|nr:MFS transporter [Salinibacterium sp.]